MQKQLLEPEAAVSEQQELVVTGVAVLCMTAALGGGGRGGRHFICWQRVGLLMTLVGDAVSLPKLTVHASKHEA